MKITIEPTEHDSGYPTVTISVQGDDLMLDNAINELIVPALLAWGYHQKSIDEVLGGER